MWLSAPEVGNCLFACAGLRPCHRLVRCSRKPRETPKTWISGSSSRSSGPQVPAGVTKSANPIDAFIAAEYKQEGPAARRPGRQADAAAPRLPRPDRHSAHARRAGRLPQRRSPDAYEKVVDQLLASEQHGVRYARHWLDVLRYADADERMTAAAGHPLLARLGDLRAEQRPALRPVRPRAVDRLPHHRAHPDGGHRRPLASSSRGPTTCSRSDSWRAATWSATTRTRRKCPSWPSRRSPPRSWA